MFNKIKNWFGKDANVNPAPAIPQPEAPPPPPPKKKESTKTAKEIATEASEPYVVMVRMDIDPNNLHQGAFELDWNDVFVARLVKAGYMMKREDTDADIVDRWFQNVCRHVVMETWDQEQAIIKGAGQYVNTRDIGGGRSEIS